MYDLIIGRLNKDIPILLNLIFNDEQKLHMAYACRSDMKVDGRKCMH